MLTGTKSGAFGANFDSESESEPSDKEEPDQQLPDSSDLVEHSILSPLSGQGESINVDKPRSPSTPDPFREKELCYDNNDVTVTSHHLCKRTVERPAGSLMVTGIYT